jgi:hypothetical protein
MRPEPVEGHNVQGRSTDFGAARSRLHRLFPRARPLEAGKIPRQVRRLLPIDEERKCHREG